MFAVGFFLAWFQGSATTTGHKPRALSRRDVEYCVLVLRSWKQTLGLSLSRGYIPGSDTALHQAITGTYNCEERAQNSTQPVSAHGCEVLRRCVHGRMAIVAQNLNVPIYCCCRALPGRAYCLVGHQDHVRVSVLFKRSIHPALARVQTNLLLPHPYLSALLPPALALAPSLTAWEQSACDRRLL